MNVTEKNFGLNPYAQQSPLFLVQVVTSAKITQGSHNSDQFVKAAFLTSSSTLVRRFYDIMINNIQPCG